MKRISVSGNELDIDIRGNGPPMLYLHPEHYAHLHEPFINKLAEHWRVFVPRHPGFDGRQPPSQFRNVGDLSYLYLDLLDQIDLVEVTLLGASFGGWIGLEMAVRNTTRLKSLELIAPLGIKLGGREKFDFVDLSALPDDEVASALFSETFVDLGKFNETQLLGIAQDRQFLAYYGWKPHLHNPSLAYWLHRINVPTRLIWGGNDGYVKSDYGECLAERMRDVEFCTIPGAGHYPQIEKLDETISTLLVAAGG